jgi:hypothetical protein
MSSRIASWKRPNTDLSYQTNESEEVWEDRADVQKQTPIPDSAGPFWKELTGS